MVHNNVIQFPATRVEPNQVFEIQKYLPKGKEIHLIEESKGTHQIPHKIFEFMFKSTETRVEASVFACLIRYTLGFHRATCETSHTFIAEWTGYSVTSVRRGLESLLAAKLIRCLESGHSHKESTVYEVDVVKGYLEALIQNQVTNPPSVPPTSEKPKNPLTVNLDQLKTDPLCRQGAQYCTDIRHSTVPYGGTKKDNTNKETNKTLTPADPLPEVLETYFSTLKPEVKKRREQIHFLSFKKLYQLQDIAIAVQYLAKNGIPGTGEKVHSPMAFLACSIGNVLPVILAEQATAQRKLERDREESEKKEKEVQGTVLAETQFADALASFNQAFPTRERQQACIQDFAKRFPIFSSNPFGLRNAAISEWGSKQKD